jgi:hypothetical protein
MDSAPHGRRQEVKQDQDYQGHGCYAQGGYPNLSEDPRIVLARKAREKSLLQTTYVQSQNWSCTTRNPNISKNGAIAGKEAPLVWKRSLFSFPLSLGPADPGAFRYPSHFKSTPFPETQTITDPTIREYFIGIMDSPGNSPSEVSSSAGKRKRSVAAGGPRSKIDYPRKRVSIAVSITENVCRARS